jgi:hypothetical protein
VADIQAQIREELAGVARRFVQIETLDYAEIMAAVGRVQALARQLPDAPTPETAPTAAADGAPAPQSVAPAAAGAPLTLTQHIENLEHLVADDLWTLAAAAKRAARAAVAKV